MKKYIILIISLLMVINLFGCGNHEPSTSEKFSQRVITENISSETNFDEVTQETFTSEAISQSITTEQFSIEETIENQEVNNKILIVYYSLLKGSDIDSDGSASRVYINGETIGSVEYVAQLIQQSVKGDLFVLETIQEYPNNYDDLISQARDELNEDYRPELVTHIDNIQDYDTIFIGYPNWWGDMPMALYSFFDEYDLSGKTIIPFNTHGGSGFSNTINIISNLEPDAIIIQNGLTMYRDNFSNYESEVSSWINDLNL